MARSPLEDAYAATRNDFRRGTTDYNEFSARMDALRAAEDDNIFTTFGKSVARSTASTIPSAMVGIGRMTGFDALAEQGEEWEQDIGRAIQINPNEEDSVPTKLGAGFGSVAGMALTGGIGGAAAKGLAAGAARYAAATRGAAQVAKAANAGQTAQKVGQYGAGISTGVGLSASEGARDYEAEMRKQGREMDPGARQKAALSVAPAGMLDFIIPAKMLNQGARIFKMKPDDLIDGIRKGTLKAAPGKAGATAKGVAAGAATEGGTEAAQQGWLNNIAKLQYDADRELSQGVIEAGLYGAATGGTVKGVGNFLEAKRFQRTYDEATKQIEDKQAQDTAIIEEATAKEAKQAATEWLDAELKQRGYVVPDVADLEFEGLSTSAAKSRVASLTARLKELPPEVREAATFDPTKTKAEYITDHPDMKAAEAVGKVKGEKLVKGKKGKDGKVGKPTLVETDDWTKRVKGKKRSGATLNKEAVAKATKELSLRYDKLVELKEAQAAEQEATAEAWWEASEPPRGVTPEVVQPQGDPLAELQFPVEQQPTPLVGVDDTSALADPRLQFPTEAVPPETTSADIQALEFPTVQAAQAPRRIIPTRQRSPADTSLEFDAPLPPATIPGKKRPVADVQPEAVAEPTEVIDKRLLKDVVGVSERRAAVAATIDDARLTAIAKINGPKKPTTLDRAAGQVINAIQKANNSGVKPGSDQAKILAVYSEDNPQAYSALVRNSGTPQQHTPTQQVAFTNETKHRNAILQKNDVGTVIANLDSPEQVPPHVQALIKPGQRPRAMLVGNQVYVFTYNLHGIEDQRRAILHEVVGHYGVNGLYGNNEAALNVMLDKLYPSLSDKKLLADIQSTYGKLTDISTLEGRRALVKEYIAHSAERLPEQDKRFFKRLWQLIRQQLRKWGMLNVPDAEIQQMLETSYAKTFGNSGAQSAYLAQTSKVRAMKEQQEKEAPLTLHVAGQQEDAPVDQEQHAFTLADGTAIGSVAAVNGDEGVYLHNIDTVDDNWAKIVVLEELNRANIDGAESVLIPKGTEAFDKWLARDLGALDFTRTDGSQWSRVNTGMAPGADQVNTRWYNAEQSYQALGENAVNTLAFKKWFGDSKVVDADGKPLVVYHGTGVDFDTADKMLWGSVKPELANDYAQMREDVGYPDAKARVLPVFMDVSTPFDADALPNSVTIRLLANEMIEQARARGKKFSKEDLSTLFASVEKAERGARVEESGPSYSRHQTWMDTQAYFGADGSKALQDMFAQTGFDGIKMHENDSLTFGVFKPEQIKSAVGNRGTFDPNDPRINFALAGDPATAVEASRYSQFIDSILAKAYNAIPDNRVKAGLTKLYTTVNSGINPTFEGLHAGVALEGKRAETLGGLDQTSNFGTRLMNNSLEERFQNETTLGEQNDWMNNGMVIADAPQSLKDNPADLAFLLRGRDEMIGLGKTLVEYKKKFDKGISWETFNENKDVYAAMLYIDYLEYSGNTSGKKLSAQEYLKQRGLTDKVTKAVLGEIKNPYFRLGYSIATVGRDVAITGYAGFIAEHTPLAIPASVDNLDDLAQDKFTREDGSTAYKSITLRGALVKLEKDGYLENDAGRVDAKLRSPHTMTEKPIRDLAAGRVDALRDEVWAKTEEVRADIEKRTGVTFKNKADWLKELKENYVFADSPRYGPLNGTYLRKEIKDDFDEAINPADDKDSPVWKATKAWYNEWKKLKVPLNPVSQIRNGFGNWFLLDMSTDTNSATLVGDTASVFKSFMTLHQGDIDIRKKAFDLTDNAQLARHITFIMGGGATSFSSAELGSSKSQLMKVVNEIEALSKGKSNIVRHMGMARVWTKYSDVMTANYQLMEQIFKSAAVKDYLRQVAKQSGAKDGVELWAALNDKMVDDGAGGRISAQKSLMRNAMAHANNAIFDYSKVHPLINKARRSPIGLPFITFSLKAIPAVADAYIHRPQKMIKYHAIPALMAGMATDWDDDELEQIRRDRPEYMRKSGSVFVMPWKQDGKYIWGDTSYLLPQSVWWNSIKTLSTWNDSQNATEAGMNLAGGLLTATGITTQPLFSLMTAASTGENTFSHRPIVREGATPGERAADTIGYMWDFMAPSTFNTTSPARDLLGYLTGWPDEQLNTRTEEPKRTAGQNVARAIGLNSTAIDPAQQRQTNRWVQQKKVRDAQKELGRITRDRSLAGPDKAEKIAVQRERIRYLRAQVGK